MKSIITEFKAKNLLDALNRRLDTAKKEISELAWQLDLKTSHRLTLPKCNL